MQGSANSHGRSIARIAGAHPPSQIACSAVCMSMHSYMPHSKVIGARMSSRGPETAICKSMVQAPSLQRTYMDVPLHPVQEPLPLRWSSRHREADCSQFCSKTAESFTELTSLYGNVSERENPSSNVRTQLDIAGTYGARGACKLIGLTGKAHGIGRVATTIPLRGLYMADSHRCMCSATS
jgi:hypothetical protein